MRGRLALVHSRTVLGALAGMILVAHGGDLDAEVSLDGLHATSRSAQAGAGPQEALSSTEIGFRVRMGLRELEDRLEVEVDYRDREPIAGTFQNRPIRLLYAGELGYAVVEDRLTLALGRFLAPAATLTPVDGVRAELEAGKWELAAYGGRRGFSQSRRNIPLGAFLPAAGGSIARVSERLQVVALGGWSKDRVILLSGGEDVQSETDIGAGHAMATLSALPVDAVRFGGQAAFNQQVTYLLGPTWSDLGVEVTAVDLWRGLVWADFEAREWLRLKIDVHHQEVGAYALGAVDTNDARLDLQEPRFTDLRGESDVGLWGHGWLRPLARYRIRHDRREWRWGTALELDDLGQRVRVDGGASFIERDAAPFGSRRVNGTAGEDLSPFVLEAQQLAFVRGFYSAERWFAGLDLERSLRDPEVRIFVQVGVLGEVGW